MAKVIQEDIETIMKRWAPIVEAGSEKIQSFEVKKAVSQLLENTAKEFAKAGLLTEATGIPALGMTSGQAYTKGKSPLGPSPIKGNKSTGYLDGTFGREKGGDGNFYLPNVIMPMVRRLFPSLIAHELVGVQALNGPLGYALAYRAKYGSDGLLGVAKRPEDEGSLDLRGKEIAFDPVDTRYTGVEGEKPLTALTSDVEVEGVYADGNASPDSAAAWKAYVGPGAGKEWGGEGAATGFRSEYASFSRGSYPTVSFDFLKQMVEAKTRKLGAGWSPELAEDMEAIHNFDVESEFVNLITYELGAEIDRQIVTEMVKTAIVGGSISGWNPAFADGLDQMGRL